MKRQIQVEFLLQTFLYKFSKLPNVHYFFFKSLLSLVYGCSVRCRYSFAHFCHDSTVRHFYPPTHKRQFDAKRGSLSMDAAPYNGKMKLKTPEKSFFVYTLCLYSISFQKYVHKKMIYSYRLKTFLGLYDT